MIHDVRLPTTVLAALTLLACGVRDIELGAGAGAEAQADASAAADAEVLRTVLTDGFPADAAVHFDTPPDAGAPADDRALSFTAPNHGARIPWAIATLPAAWDADKDFDRFELRMRVGPRTLRLLSAEPAVRPSAEDYRWLVGDAQQHEVSLDLRLRALSSKADARGGEAASLSVAPDMRLQLVSPELEGQLYFWSTGDQAIMRASLAGEAARKFYPNPEAGGATQCAGCHTLSRDGRRMAVARDGEYLREVSVPEGLQVLPAATATVDAGAGAGAGVDERPAYGFGTFDPGATRLLYADRGRLRLIDADTGETLSDAVLDATHFATHPDWAPDGRHVVVSLLDRAPADNDQVDGAQIAVLPAFTDGSFGPPEVLVEAADKDETLVFPSYSPDGAYIAFARMRGKSKDQKTAELWLVPSGGGEAIALTRLNRQVGHDPTKTKLGNTMPTWAPTRAAGRYFLTFSSSRPVVGERLGDKRDQLWLAAVDLTAGAPPAGIDPSFPAVWLPFQDVADSNHRAFWAPAGSPLACVAGRELCDGLDDDCDGRTDEDCCTPQRELCGDGLDNDCDGERDEGCGCAAVDQCGNGLDDDCDLSVDEDCLL